MTGLTATTRFDLVAQCRLGRGEHQGCGSERVSGRPTLLGVRRRRARPSRWACPAGTCSSSRRSTAVGGWVVAEGWHERRLGSGKDSGEQPPDPPAAWGSRGRLHRRSLGLAASVPLSNRYSISAVVTHVTGLGSMRAASADGSASQRRWVILGMWTGSMPVTVTSRARNRSAAPTAGDRPWYAAPVGQLGGSGRARRVSRLVLGRPCRSVGHQGARRSGRVGVPAARSPCGCRPRGWRSAGCNPGCGPARRCRRRITRPLPVRRASPSRWG